MSTAVGICLAICLAAAFCLVCAIRSETATPISPYERRKQCVERGRYHFQCAIAYWRELVELEGYATSDWEADVLFETIMDDVPYEEAIKTIMEKWRPCKGLRPNCDRL